jgi:hypothetical protein
VAFFCRVEPSHSTERQNAGYQEPKGNNFRGLIGWRIQFNPGTIGCFYSGHLISLFARASTSGGIVSPICSAVLRFITSSNFVGCSIPSSRGPLRTADRDLCWLLPSRLRDAHPTNGFEMTSSRRRPPQSPVPPRDTLARRFHTGPRRRTHDVSWSGCPESIVPRGWTFGSKSFP